jgi:ribonucleoside-diphosphate reductase alpha chain
MTDDADVRMAQSIMDYIFRRLALDYLPFEKRAALGIYSAEERQRQLETGSYEPIAEPEDAADAGDAASLTQDGIGTDDDSAADRSGVKAAQAKPAPRQAHTSTELLEAIQGRTADAPLCFTCGTKMRPAGSCFVCEGCGSTSGCS